MAKKAHKKTLKKNVPGKAVKKTRMANKTVTTTGRARAAKTTGAKRTAIKMPAPKKASKKKLPAKLAKRVATVKADPKLKTAVKPTGLKATGPATRKQSVPQPVQPTRPASATLKPAASVSPQPAPALQIPKVFSNRGEVMAEGFQPGQRVRHRYEHWWGTIVQKADSSGSKAAAGAPAPVRYVVKLDGGQNRDDIRPEDLTVT